MHEARSFTPSPSATARSPWLNRPQTRRKLAIYAGAALIGVLVVAWIDGGEEPIRTIVQPVEVSANTAVGGAD